MTLSDLDDSFEGNLAFHAYDCEDNFTFRRDASSSTMAWMFSNCVDELPLGRATITLRNHFRFDVYVCESDIEFDYRATPV